MNLEVSRLIYKSHGRLHVKWNHTYSKGSRKSYILQIWKFEALNAHNLVRNQMQNVLWQMDLISSSIDDDSGWSFFEWAAPPTTVLLHIFTNFSFVWPHGRCFLFFFFFSFFRQFMQWLTSYLYSWNFLVFISKQKVKKTNAKCTKTKEDTPTLKGKRSISDTTHCNI